MQLTWYLAAATAVTVAQASPHPPHWQQPLQETILSPAQPVSPSHELSNIEDVISSSPLLSFHRDLIEIDSISGNEHNVGLFVAEFLKSKNFTVVKQEVAPVKQKQSDDDNVAPKQRYNIYAYPALLKSCPPSS
jgi:acetylornithine deacetylase